jgi:hypothetical protein
LLELKNIALEPRRDGIALSEGLSDVGKGPCPFSNYNLAFALEPRKSAENFSQGSRLLDNGHVDLASVLGVASTGLLNISPPLPVGDFSQPLIGTSGFQVARTKGFPASQNFE